MSGKLIIGKPQFHCPGCGTEWYKSDLENLDSIGCPGCAKKFILESYRYENEPLYHDRWQKYYDRMVQEHEKHSAI